MILKISIPVIFVLALIGLTGCPVSKEADSAGKVPEVVPPEVTIVMPGAKICQLVGEYDREKKKHTLNRTYSNYQLKSTDLGVPFRFADRTYILFGDTQGKVGGDRDAIAYTTDTTPDNGLALTFIHDSKGIYKPVTIPGIDQGAYDVPMEGVEANGKMYVYTTTGHTATKGMGKSVIARSDDSGNTFHKLYTFSGNHFINLSIVKADASKWKLFPDQIKGKVLVIFGTGVYRLSDVYLACQPANEIENKNTIHYFAGIDHQGKPVWSNNEQKAVPLFNEPLIGELSVTFNQYIHRWIMLYNCYNPTSIMMRTARNPWGPWTQQQVLFNVWRDNGFCHFIHASWHYRHCDSVMDTGRENDWGAVYGPYQYAYLAKGDSTATKSFTTIYFDMSTWNPYTVVLMKAKLVR